MGIAILMFRRYTSICGKAELGGPRVTKYASGLIMIALWMFYIIVSALENYGYEK